MLFLQMLFSVINLDLTVATVEVGGLEINFNAMFCKFVKQANYIKASFNFDKALSLPVLSQKFSRS